MSKFQLGCAPSHDDINEARECLEFFGSAVNEIITDRGPVGDQYVADCEAMREATAFFEEQGWAFSGSGFFSAVYVKGGLAMKVGFKKEDSGATYAAWCRANQGRPGVPVIHAIDKFPRCYLVVMDRCYPVQMASPLDPRMEAEMQTIRDVIEVGDEPLPQFPTSVTAAMIRCFFEGIAHFDVNRGNLMLSRDGDVIITDPVSYDHSPRGHSQVAYTYAYGGTSPSPTPWGRQDIPQFLMPAA